MNFFHGWDSTASRLEPLRGGSLLFTRNLSSQKFLVPIFINLGRMNNANTEIWSKGMSIGPYVAKMLFLQVDEGFWLY